MSAAGAAARPPTGMGSPPRGGQGASPDDVVQPGRSEDPAPADAGSARPDDASAGSDDPDRPSGAPAEALRAGHWWASDQVGSCTDIRTWYSFDPQGGLVSRQVDHNFCSGTALLSETSGHYALAGRVLEFTLEGAGTEGLRGMPIADAAIGQRFERMTIAIAEGPEAGAGAGTTYLDARAFSSSDGASFESSHGIRLTSDAGEVVFARDAKLVLLLNPPLPLDDGAHTAVTLRAVLSLQDPTRASDEQGAAEAFIRYTAVVRAEGGWLRIVPLALDTATGREAYAAWRAYLDMQGIGPQWVRQQFEQSFYPMQRFMRGDSTLLVSSLPDYRRWTRSSNPPQLP